MGRASGDAAALSRTPFKAIAVRVSRDDVAGQEGRAAASSARSARIPRSDVWAVGWFGTATRINTLILRWNGTTWTQVASPSPGVNQASLNGVTVLSPTNAWAVGEYFDGTSDLTLILHWNGTTWTQVPTPNPLGTSPVLNGVSASSATNAWATGIFFGGAQSSTLTERWNGTKWKVVASPNPGAHSNSLNAISADAANDAWVAGQDNNRPGGFKNLLEHWDGSTWTAS
jgi:hypothetical protein